MNLPVGWKEHPEYGMCRTLTGHGWALPKGHAFKVDGSEVIATLVCRNCGGGKRMHMNRRTGAILKTPRQYPPDYLLKGIGRSPNKGKLRSAYLDLVLGT